MGEKQMRIVLATSGCVVGKPGSGFAEIEAEAALRDSVREPDFGTIIGEAQSAFAPDYLRLGDFTIANLLPTNISQEATRPTGRFTQAVWALELTRWRGGRYRVRRAQHYWSR